MTICSHGNKIFGGLFIDNWSINLMRCIYCQSETSVINSRPQKRTNRTWRRRTCLACKTTFTSIEAVNLAGSIAVTDANDLQPFSRDKLFLSVYDSLKHRKTAQKDATGLTDTIISTLYALMNNATLNKSNIVATTIKTLSRFDRAAATHYEAFHPIEESD